MPSQLPGHNPLSSQKHHIPKPAPPPANLCVRPALCAGPDNGRSHLPMPRSVH